MLDSHLRKALADMTEDLEVLKGGDPARAPGGALHANANYRDWVGVGFPTKSGGAITSGTSNPTERTALQALSRKERDALARDWAKFDEHIETARRALRRAVRNVTAGTMATDRPGAEGCSVCERARVDGRPHLEHWQPIYVRRRPPAAGPDAPQARYCSFCAEFVERYGIEPGMVVTLYHLDHLGTRVPHSLIRDTHPAEFARAQGHRVRKSA